MKTTLLAALSALALAGCGQSGPSYNPGARNSGALAPASDARSLSPAEQLARSEADAWAVKAFAIYGADAVNTCLAAFHSEILHGGADLDVGELGKPQGYRFLLAEYMCACARGTSKDECPVP